MRGQAPGQRPAPANRPEMAVCSPGLCGRSHNGTRHRLGIVISFLGFDSAFLTLPGAAVPGLGPPLRPRAASQRPVQGSCRSGCRLWPDGRCAEQPAARRRAPRSSHAASARISQGRQRVVELPAAKGIGSGRQRGWRLLSVCLLQSLEEEVEGARRQGTQMKQKLRSGNEGWGLTWRDAASLTLDHVLDFGSEILDRVLRSSSREGEAEVGLAETLPWDLALVL